MRISSVGLKVLNYFLTNRFEEASGSDVSRVVRVGSGTLYPMLARFEQAGWLDSRWEDVIASEEGRPRKRLYRLTGVGIRCAAEELAGLVPAEPIRKIGGGTVSYPEGEVPV